MIQENYQTKKLFVYMEVLYSLLKNKRTNLLHNINQLLMILSVIIAKYVIKFALKLKIQI